MSFIYPHIISITRPGQDTAVGYSPTYSGVQPSNETPVASGLPASIQLKKEKGKPDPNLPADAAAKTFWTVFIPFAYAPLGLIATNDIITDDLGNRYQITGAYWNSLGYAALAELLEP